MGLYFWGGGGGSAEVWTWSIDMLFLTLPLWGCQDMAIVQYYGKFCSGIVLHYKIHIQILFINKFELCLSSFSIVLFTSVTNGAKMFPLVETGYVITILSLIGQWGVGSGEVWCNKKWGWCNNYFGMGWQFFLGSNFFLGNQIFVW